MSESYQHVVKGGLKLKGGVSAAGGVKKKKKKREISTRKYVETHGDDARRRTFRVPPRIRARTRSRLRLSLVRHLRRKRDAEALDAAVAEGGSVPPPATDTRTAAERRFDEQAAKTQEKLTRSMASKSHRDKVKDFNEYLSKLSEHHDIPKVGPGVMIRRNTRCETSPRVTHARRPLFSDCSQRKDTREARRREATRRGARVFSMIGIPLRRARLTPTRTRCDLR